MTFDKPKDVTYTQMAIYIDNNVYEKEFDEALVYQYIYHLVYMLAVKRCFFTKTQYYDDFALMSASRVYMRLINPKQFELNENGKPKLSKIKSVLNYIKTLMYPMKVAFEQSNYSQVYSENTEDIVPVRPISSSNSSSLISMEILDYIQSLPKVIYRHLLKIPKKKSSDEWLNIYTSCLLTLLNNFTLTNKKLSDVENKENITDNYIEKMYQLDDVLLFHLDKSYHDYIQILTRELKDYIYDELREIVASYDIERCSIRDVMQDAIDGIVSEESD